MWEYDDYEPEYDAEEERPPDPRQEKAREVLAKFFESHPDQVYFSRQLEVIHERQYFHWKLVREAVKLHPYPRRGFIQ